MMQRAKKAEKGATRSIFKPEQSRYGARRFVVPETEQQTQGGLCGPLCSVNLMDLPLRAKAEPNRTGLPDQLKAGIESLSGMDMSDVRVHANSDKPAQLNALAYAQGHDIHLAPGEEQHLSHEAWHVVQQKMGLVRPTLQAKGVGINDDPGLEQEADRMGKKAARGMPDGILPRNRDFNFFDTPNRTSKSDVFYAKDTIQLMKWIRRRDNRIIQVNDDYVLKKGQHFVPAPETQAHRDREQRLQGIPRLIRRADRDFSATQNRHGQGKAHLQQSGLRAAGDIDIGPGEQLIQDSPQKGSSSIISFTGPSPSQGGQQYGGAQAQTLMVKARKIERAKIKGKPDAQHLGVLTSHMIHEIVRRQYEGEEQRTRLAFLGRDDEHQIRIGEPQPGLDPVIPNRFLYGAGVDETHDSDSESDS